MGEAIEISLWPSKTVTILRTQVLQIAIILEVCTLRANWIRKCLKSLFAKCQISYLSRIPGSAWEREIVLTAEQLRTTFDSVAIDFSIDRRREHLVRFSRLNLL